jgi:peptidoglycan/LPS O-acetylase OafA/YrhL
VKSPAKHVECIDNLRGVAIIAVVLFHTLGVVYGYGELPWRGWFRGFSVPISFLGCLPLSFGKDGVAVFFVVSGFCIHLSFQQQGRKWGDFFLRRFFRLYPAYLAAVIFFVWLLKAPVAAGVHSGGFWWQVGAHLLLVQNIFSQTVAGINPSFWSLGVEAQLYLLYPVLLALASRLGWGRTMVLLAGLELLIRGAYGWLAPAGGVTSAGRAAVFLARSPLGYWFSWSVGAWIAEAYLKGDPLPFVKSSLTGWGALVMLSYFFKPLDAFEFLWVAVLTAGVTSKLLSGAAPRVNIPAGSLAWLRNLGLWSYSLYLLHQPIIEVALYVIAWVLPGGWLNYGTALLLMAAALAGIILFSCLWYHVFEVPGIAWGRRIIRGPAAGPVEAGWLTRSYFIMAGALLVIGTGIFLANARLRPLTPEEGARQAWQLATSPDAGRRNGARAVQLAEDACRRTHYREPVPVMTLAAAYAEAGRFDEAAATAQKASALAAKAGDLKLLQINEKLVTLFAAHQPYREPE